MTGSDFLKMAAVAMEAIGLLKKFTDSSDDKAVASLAAIRAGFDLLEKGFAGESSPQAVLTELEVLYTRITGNDAAIGEAAHKKFHPEP